ncbi:hypothetical protein D3C81_2169990 [compost metagenome]
MDDKRTDTVRIGAKYGTGTADGFSHGITEALRNRGRQQKPSGSGYGRIVYRHHVIRNIREDHQPVI